MTSRETAEDVLREIAERYSGDKMLMHYRDRIERALAGRAEAVYQVRCHDPENSEAWFDVTEYGYRCNVDKGRDARILYTHPPASVPEVTDAMAERAAIAVAEDWQREQSNVVLWPDLPEGGRELARAQVRVVLAALQEQRHD